MPVSQSATETPIATMPSGTRLDMNATMASARMTSVIATGLMPGPYRELDAPSPFG